MKQLIMVLLLGYFFTTPCLAAESEGTVGRPDQVIYAEQEGTCGVKVVVVVGGGKVIHQGKVEEDGTGQTKAEEEGTCG